MQLEAAEKRGELERRAEEAAELRKLRRLFSERPAPPPQSILERLRLGPPGEWADEDPTFDRWAAMAKARKIPDDWWGPLGKDPAKLAALKAKLARKGVTTAKE